ncbi:MAG: peptide ABC transporter permease [Gammaproteobacteria bacterium]|uniref:Peptide ABC transporter permease n=1 Tax=OM182 bacterium MED-G24 TaxID=1986255 RepID=A0A2A5WZE9_9GAMM|nr:peptide ABC transporter permease [Gammaproteobacteria bacterium]PDH41920.1 MAG: peptide ABC transporter permease [OM182 bacterium MED-G24]RPG27494.1 MAG: ABC transporter permease [Gammaproteobacteria bacterium TMED50]|tara:strand:- start:752 stop:1777 length:1026 start_codon:yes stop_codon:yes gene_type:complete
MRDYFIRRLLLIPPTLLGVTVIVFVVTRFVPGGPLERAIAESQQLDAQGGIAVEQVAGHDMALSDDQLQKLREYYGFDKPVLVSYGNWVLKVIQGDLGTSYRYNEPVWDVIRARFPISLYYGIVTLILTYAVCIPLGILKAIRHRTVVDNVTSILIFVGYAIPGYALGSLLLLYFSVTLDWFPMSGFTSYNFSELSLGGKVLDIISHSVLPLICYLVGSFALVTLLLKNHLMDNLASDYIRTAIAKGVSFRKSVTRHALRNSLIPIATTFGQNITLILSGSFLIESVFDIDGFGLLGLTSILDRDYPVVMGIVFLASLLLLIGNILSDILVALVDPRIRFQ